ARAMMRTMVMAILADGQKTQQEEVMGRIFASTIPVLAGMEEAELTSLIKEAYDALAAEGIAASLAFVARVINQDELLAAQAFAPAAAVTLADRQINAREVELLDRLRQALSLSADDARELISSLEVAMRIKSAAAPEPPTARHGWQELSLAAKSALDRED